MKREIRGSIGTCIQRAGGQALDHRRRDVQLASTTLYPAAIYKCALIRHLHM